LATEKYDDVGQLCLYMLCVILFSGVCVGIRAGTFNVLSERIARNLRKDFYGQVVDKDIAFFDTNRTGELVSRLNSDVQVIQDTLGTNISMFIRGSLFILITIVIMLTISPLLTSTVFGAIIPIIIFSVFLMIFMRKIQKTIQEEKSHMNTIAEESFANVRTVKAFQNEDVEIERF
jgi:ABC-type multidrug transport system fused ATPase/permease subunit